MVSTLEESSTGSSYFDDFLEDEDDDTHTCSACSNKAEWVGILNSPCPHDGRTAYACGPHAREWQDWEKTFIPPRYTQHCIICGVHPTTVTWKKL